MPKVYTEKKCLTDLVKWECHPLYCRDVMSVTAGDTDVEITVGQPFVRSTGIGLTDDNVSSLDCLTFENTLIPAGNTEKIRVLARGPAILSESGLEVPEAQREAVKTRFQTLGFQFIREPEKTATQTT